MFEIGSMDEDFPNDESHPIPWMDKIDVVVRTDNGAYYGVVIASPLNGEASNQDRLLRKLDHCFDHIRADQAHWRASHDTEMKVRLWVGIHPGSSPVIFELIDQVRAWADDNDFEFKVLSTGDSNALH